MSNSTIDSATVEPANGRAVLESDKLSGTTQAGPAETRLALAFILVLLAAVVLLNAKLFGNITHDFVVLYTGASIMHQGNGPRLYDLSEQAKVQANLLVGKPCLNCDRNTQADWARAQAALLKGKPLLVDNHPPFEALLFAPLAAFSYGRAYVIWGAINIAIWLLFVHLIRPYLTFPTQTFQYVVLCFAFFPLWAALMQGQTSLLVLLAFTLTFICLKRRRDFKAGLCLGLGLFKFPIVLPFALICLLRRKWKLIAGFACAGSILAAFSLVAIGPAGVRSYVCLLLDQAKHPNTREYGIRPGCMANVRALLTAILPRAFPRHSVDLAAAILSGFLILGMAWAWDRLERHPGRPFDLAFASALAISEVTAFHTLIHDLSPTLLAILLAIGVYAWPKKSSWRHALTATLVALYVLPVCLLFVSRGRAFWLLALVPIVFAVIALVAARTAATGQLSPSAHDLVVVAEKLGLEQ
jgi:hypothetical protein